MTDRNVFRFARVINMIIEEWKSLHLPEISEFPIHSRRGTYQGSVTVELIDGEVKITKIKGIKGRLFDSLKKDLRAAGIEVEIRQLEVKHICSGGWCSLWH